MSGHPFVYITSKAQSTILSLLCCGSNQFIIQSFILSHCLNFFIHLCRLTRINPVNSIFIYNNILMPKHKPGMEDFADFTDTIVSHTTCQSCQ